MTFALPPAAGWALSTCAVWTVCACVSERCFRAALMASRALVGDAKGLEGVPSPVASDPAGLMVTVIADVGDGPDEVPDADADADDDDDDDDLGTL